MLEVDILFKNKKSTLSLYFNACYCLKIPTWHMHMISVCCLLNLPSLLDDKYRMDGKYEKHILKDECPQSYDSRWSAGTVQTTLHVNVNVIGQKNMEWWLVMKCHLLWWLRGESQDWFLSFSRSLAFHALNLGPFFFKQCATSKVIQRVCTLKIHVTFPSICKSSKEKERLWCNNYDKGALCRWRHLSSRD